MICYDVVRDWLLEHRGIELPDVSGVSSVEDALALAAKWRWQVVDSPAHGDVVLMRPSPHVGIYLRGGKVMHYDSRLGMVVERVKAPHVKRKIKAYLRWAP